MKHGSRQGAKALGTIGTSDLRHTVVQTSQASVDDLALVLVTVGRIRACAVQVNAGRGIVEL